MKMNDKTGAAAISLILAFLVYLLVAVNELNAGDTWNESRSQEMLTAGMSQEPLVGRVSL